MKRVLLVLCGALLLWIGGRALVHALASDETRIRWLVEDMAEGFGRTRTGAILEGLEKGFVDETSGVDRETLRGMLAHFFLTEKDPATKRFPWRVEATIESLVVERPAATCEVLARFFELRGEEEEERPGWTIRVEGRLEDGEDGWRFVRTSHETLEGRRPR